MFRMIFLKSINRACKYNAILGVFDSVCAEYKIDFTMKTFDNIMNKNAIFDSGRVRTSDYQKRNT